MNKTKAWILNMTDRIHAFYFSRHMATQSSFQMGQEQEAPF
jgi:hypothetical protein